MTNLTSRILSAIAAIIILTFVIYNYKAAGVYGLITFVVIRGSHEFARMVFKNNFSKKLIYFYVFFNSILFLLLTYYGLKPLAILLIITSFSVSVLYGVLLHKQFNDLQSILNFVSLFCLGSIYTALIPATVAWLVLKPDNGLQWFFCLLTVVFAGDIGAYIFGVTMGKTKIAPSLSPNKSVQGAIGGLFFSMIAALSFSYVLPGTPLWLLAFCGVFGGFLGQVGDFFESLIKRVSGVKDSGSIMPGHGGLLDRLDGILMAAPLFYYAANLYSL